jgi:hypothetical protein
MPKSIELFNFTFGLFTWMLGYYPGEQFALFRFVFWEYLQFGHLILIEITVGRISFEISGDV